jgi:predicted ATPase
MSAKLKQIRIDGYKNLINCVVNLGDFNVLVGPNNSGKSNLLEAIQTLRSIMFGSDSERKNIFDDGLTPLSRNTTWICHLDKYKNIPLTIDILLEVEDEREKWEVEYGIVIEPKQNDKEGGIIHEYLKAKETSKTGKAKTYFTREKDILAVGKKKHPISKQGSSYEALSMLYGDAGKKSEIYSRLFISHIVLSTFSTVYAMWPKGLRKACEKDDAPMGGLHTTYFNPLIAMDDIKENNEKDFQTLGKIFCDTLDFEDLDFTVDYLGKEKEGENRKRFRECRIKRAGSPAVDIAEYSDGTFDVLGILTAYFSPKRKGSLFMLEELENCLHPKALEKMLRFFQDNAGERPVLLTTHSPYLLNGVRPEDVIVAVTDKDGATHFEKVGNNKELRTYLNKGLYSFGDLLISNYDSFRG